jgi:hypothetical protein
MTTSPATSMLSKPTGNDPIPIGTLGYFSARHRHRVHSLVLREFKKSKLSQADLARRLRKSPDVICRLLGAPGNWTLDTVSNLLFAIGGGEPTTDIAYPLDQPARNYTGPEWLIKTPDWVEREQKKIERKSDPPSLRAPQARGLAEKEEEGRVFQQRQGVGEGRQEVRRVMGLR